MINIEKVRFSLIHHCTPAGGGVGLTDINFVLGFANSSHQVEMMGNDQPQTRKWIELLDDICDYWREATKSSSVCGGGEGGKG